MREVLKKLEQVQEIDLQINAILRKKAEFPTRLQNYDTEIKSHVAKYEEKKKIVDELDRARRQQLGALELNEERMKRSQDKADLVKTNQEYQAILKELDSLKKTSAVIQENSKKMTEDYDRHKTEAQELESAMNGAQAKRDEELAKITDEEHGFDGELARLRGERDKETAGVDRRYLEAYDRVRGSRSGLGIAHAIAGNCKGCNMRIPPQIYNELQRGTELHICPSCRRILVYKAPGDNSDSRSSAAASG